MSARDPIPAYVHLLRAKDLIDRAYGEALDVPALAHTALASPKHFIRSFRGAFGKTPHQYLLGFEIRTDATMDTFRWLTVGPPTQPDCELILAVPARPMPDPESADRSYAVEATFRDNSGNWFSLTERAEVAAQPA